ncbi:MAG: two-component regulator propeller domain-containing protein [Saprospiraceae bacterium]|nr:two-component regulator propeller domain-containing protein [Saprospiraceae bacterium]
MNTVFKYFPVVLFSLLIACKEQHQTQALQHQPSTGLPKSFATVLKADTIFIPQAPSRITRNIKMDAQQNLVFAAYEDILFYNGSSFTKLPKPEGFESFDAFDAIKDSKGNIWIASNHDGLFCFDGKKVKQFTVEHGLPHNRTMKIYEDKSGAIWIATMGGISYYNGKSFRNFSTVEGLSHNEVNTIFEDRFGKIWLGTRGSACIYDPTSSTFTLLKTNERETLENVWSILEDQQGVIWIMGQHGIWRKTNTVIHRISKKGGGHLHEAKNGNIWFTTLNSLSYFDKDSLHLESPNSSEVFVGDGMFFGLTEDKDGNIWVGTLNSVFKYDGESVLYYQNIKS